MYKYKDISMCPIEKDDIDFLIELRSSTWESLGTIKMLNITTQEKWIEKISLSESHLYCIVYKGIEKIGLVRMDEIDYINRSIRIGGDIHPKYRGEGYGISMINMVIEYCFDCLNMNRIWLMVLENNDIAKHIYNKVGFKEEGRQRKAIYRNGEYVDYIMMGVLRDEL